MYNYNLVNTQERMWHFLPVQENSIPHEKSRSASKQASIKCCIRSDPENTKKNAKKQLCSTQCVENKLVCDAW